MKKRIISLVLSFSMIISMCVQAKAIDAPPVAQGSVMERLEQLKEAFPHGSLFTATGKTCGHGRGTTCSNCSLHKIMDVMGYSSSNRPWNSWTCVGFSRFAFWYIFGVADTVSSYKGIATAGASIINISQAKPGDMVALKKNGSNFHYGIYLSHTVGANGAITVNVFDANGGSSSQINVVSHSTSFAYESGSYIVRANNYDEIESLATEKSVFNDVSLDAYYYDSVLWAVENGITVGTGNSMFSPLENVTLGQVLMFLYRATGSSDTVIENPFSDVSESDYYYKAVLWALENGVIVVNEDEKLEANNMVTRAEIVYYIYKVKGSKEPGAVYNLDDVNESDYYYDAVNFALENGITTGTSATTFNPNGLTTRSEIVTFLNRAFG